MEVLTIHSTHGQLFEEQSTIYTAWSYCFSFSIFFELEMLRWKTVSPFPSCLFFLLKRKGIPEPYISSRISIQVFNVLIFFLLRQPLTSPPSNVSPMSRSFQNAPLQPVSERHVNEEFEAYKEEYVLFVLFAWSLFLLRFHHVCAAHEIDEN